MTLQFKLFKVKILSMIFYTLTFKLLFLTSFLSFYANSSLANDADLNITLEISDSSAEIKNIRTIANSGQSNSGNNNPSKKNRLKQNTENAIPAGQLLIIATDSEDNKIFTQLIDDPGFVRAEIFSSQTGENEFSDSFYRELTTLSFSISNNQDIAFLSIYRPDLTNNKHTLQLLDKLPFTPLRDVILPPPSSIYPEAIDVTTILNNGDSSNRVDIAILGDGYTTDELDTYAQDVSSVMDAYFDIEPYKGYKSFFNVHRIDVVSNDSGIDHPENSLYKDTALHGEYNCNGIQRLICVDSIKAMNIAADMLDDKSYDIILVVVNDDEYGGSGGSIAVISTHTSATSLALHEIGHSFGLLADEYEFNPELCDLSEPTEPNTTTILDRTTTKWAHWIDSNTPLPTDTSYDSTPGLYEGSQYCLSDKYRPTNNSMMRTLEQPFYKINEEALIKRIYNYVVPIDAYSPAQESVEVQSSQLFSLTVPTTQSDTISANWYLNDTLVASGKSYTLSASNLVSGNNQLRAEIADSTDSENN